MAQNPVKRVRLAKGWTQRQLAAQLSVTPMYILRVEQGLLQQLPLNFTNALGVEPKEYRDWVRHQRTEANRLPAPPVGVDGVQVTVARYLESVYPRTSTIEKCKRLYMHPSTLVRYLRSPKARLPQQLYEAFTELGLTEGDLKQWLTR